MTPTGGRSQTSKHRTAGNVVTMKLMRTAAVAAVAKKVYDEARKPHNQVKIRQATEKVRQQMQSRRRPY